MKSLAFTLSEEDILESFFYKARLFGLKTNHLGYEICNVLNRKLDYNFEAAPDLTLDMSFSDSNTTGLDLFSGLRASFLVYRNNMAPCSTEMFLYQNYSNTFFLLPEFTNVSYFLLVYNDEMLLYNMDFIDVLRKIEIIEEVEEIPLDELKQFANLLF